MYRDKRPINITLLIIFVSVLCRILLNLVLGANPTMSGTSRVIGFEFIDVLFYFVNVVAGLVAVRQKNFPPILFFSFDTRMSIVVGSIYSLVMIGLGLLHLTKLYILLT
jgi:hypothetical protein